MTERTDEQRWADAESILDGEPTEFAVQELRRRRRRIRNLMWSLAAFFLLAVGGSLVLIVVFGHHGHHAAPSSRVPVWEQVTGLALSVAGTVVILVGLVGYIRSGALRDVWRSPALVLTRAQRRELSKQIRGRAPIEPDRVRVARYVTELAAGPRARRYFAFLSTGIVLELIGQLVMWPSAGRVIYSATSLVLFAAAVVFAVSRRRQMRAFLERTRQDAVR